MSNIYKGRAHRERVTKVESGRKVARHEDYKRRSVLFKRKRALIRAGRKAAATKNPDEFHFAMEHAHTGTDGQLVFSEKSLSQDALRRSIDTSRRVVKHQAAIEASRLDSALAGSTLSISLPPGGVTSFRDSSDSDSDSSPATAPPRNRFAAVTSPSDVRSTALNPRSVLSDAVSLARPSAAAASRAEVLARRQRLSRLRLHDSALEHQRSNVALKRTRTVSVGSGPPSKRRNVVVNRQQRAK